MTAVSSTCQLLCSLSLGLGLSDVLPVWLELGALGGDIKFPMQHLVEGRARWPLWSWRGSAVPVVSLPGLLLTLSFFASSCSSPLAAPAPKLSPPLRASPAPLRATSSASLSPCSPRLTGSPSDPGPQSITPAILCLEMSQNTSQNPWCPPDPTHLYVPHHTHL